MREDKNEIRCICSRRPLLARYGVGPDGSPFIHIKIFKQSRIYGEVFVSADAVVRIRCRECLRLQKVRIISGRPEIEEDKRSSVGRVDNVDPAFIAPTSDDGIR